MRTSAINSGHTPKGNLIGTVDSGHTKGLDCKCAKDGNTKFNAKGRCYLG